MAGVGGSPAGTWACSWEGQKDVEDCNVGGFGNISFDTGEGESWGKGWGRKVMSTKGNGFIKHL